MNMQRFTLTLIGAALAATSFIAPQLADACGGFFCDFGPQIMPVDQTGETIVFWIDHSGSEPHTEAHIQIQYEGEAEQFAWIIPVTAVPEISVGSQALFDNMLTATVPTFSVNNRTEGDCSGGVGIGCAKSEASPNRIDLAGGDEGGLTGGESDTNGVEILDRGFAGAFEYVTLTGGDVQEIVDWLDTNGYAQDDEAPPILDEYLQDDFVFVAIKLRGGAEVEEIHPLVVRYAGIEPCIPLKLTRIAAVDDMAVRAMFLGQSRVAPQNWPHVVINHTLLDWVNGPAPSYPGVVGAAIDEAGGRAFVTEYAGTAAVVSTSGVFDAQWDASAFEGIEPVDVVDTLAAQGLIACSDDVCEFNHPQVEPLLQTYLPPPAGVDAHVFWSCLGCYADMIDPVLWSAPPGFAADIQDRIVGPGEHAVTMLEGTTTLTRLYTLISPHEMIDDPLFHETDSLPTVDNNITATRVNDCDSSDSWYELSDGRIVALTEGGAMPDLDGNPAAERIEQVPMMGPAQVEVDNRDLIDDLLADWNDGRISGPDPGCSIGRVGLGELLAMLGIFGIAWGHRRRRD